MKCKDNIQEIERHLTTWFILIAASNALSYFDINKISEGTALYLLNLLYDFKLKDLNNVIENYPGIDVGDTSAVGIAFQITSRTDIGKIKKTLKTFQERNYIKEYPKGVRILVLSTKKLNKKNNNGLACYSDFFDIKRDIVGIRELMQRVIELYYENPARFEKVRSFLATEFGAYSNKRCNSLINFKTKSEKLAFYRELFLDRFQSSVNNYIPIEPTIEDKPCSLDDLKELLLNNKGQIIYGPSGCGKSTVARMLAIQSFDHYIPVIIEAKYYDSSLVELFTKEVVSYNFSSDADFIDTVSVLNHQIVFFVDGLNECDENFRKKLLIELKKAVDDWNIKLIITTQLIYAELGVFNLIQGKISAPSEELKYQIASAYNLEGLKIKNNSIFRVISTGLEAKMLGEIWSNNSYSNNRFTLFNSFIDKKLGNKLAGAILLLSSIAQYLSDKFLFSLPEYIVQNFVADHKLDNEVYNRCVESGLLDLRSGKISFIHEMFLNFFVANNILRTLKNSDLVIDELNAPKNYDKRLFIIGSVTDPLLLNKILGGLTDSALFTLLAEGEGGEFCKLWVENEYQLILDKMGSEISNCKFYFCEEYGQFDFVEGAREFWSDNELALIGSIPDRLAKGEFLVELMDLIAQMDSICEKYTNEFWGLGKSKGISSRSSIFSAVYSSASPKVLGISFLFKIIYSGLFGFQEKIDISEDQLEKAVLNRELTNGQVYLLLLLFRFNVQLKILYKSVVNTLQNWRFYPSHLLTEIIDQLRYFADDSDKRSELIKLINAVHSETNNAMISTFIFDQLQMMGELEDDNLQFVTAVEDEMMLVLAKPEDHDSCILAASIYYRQFDHPYAEAHTMVIDRLSEINRKLFFQMALKGESTKSLFTISLIRDAYNEIGDLANQYILKWTESPDIDQIFSNDALALFVIVHYLLGKNNVQIPLRDLNLADRKESSIRAISEIFYWDSRFDISEKARIDYIKPLSTYLFDENNEYIIQTIVGVKEALFNYRYHNFLDLNFIERFEDSFKRSIAIVSRKCIKNFGCQSGIFRYPTRFDEIKKNAISFLGQHGTLLDVNLLLPLAEDPIFGRTAINAIQNLNRA